MSPIRFLTITEFKAKATAVVAEVQRTGRQVVVTVKGKPAVIISPVNEEEFEVVKPKKI
jgi:prevent-host-death family protein